jgi:hypothetical protein
VPTVPSPSGPSSAAATTTSPLQGGGEQCPVEGAVDAAGRVVVVGYRSPKGTSKDAACCMTVTTSDCAVADRRYGAWASTDRSTWAAADPADFPSSGGQEFSAVTVTPSGFVAVGGSWRSHPGDFAATAYASADGLHWRQVTAWDGPVANDGTRQVMVDVTATSSALVAVGFSEEGAGAERRDRAKAFVGGLDGRNLTPVSFPAHDRGQRAFGVAAVGADFVAVGRQETSDAGGDGWSATVWRSRGNANTWQLAYQLPGARYREFSAVAS